MVNKQKILIVDDDENIAELISLYLTKECFDTKIVHDGESALEAHKTFQPDLILLDIMLPRMDGYQVCRELRTYSGTPVIMLSAKSLTVACSPHFLSQCAVCTEFHERTAAWIRERIMKSYPIPSMQGIISNVVLRAIMKTCFI